MEVCVGGVWGTVCDDLWDSIDAEVVCKQLGLSTNGESLQYVAHVRLLYFHIVQVCILILFLAGALAAARSWYGPGTGPIVLDDVECAGTEAALHLCPHGGLGNHDCSESEHASVICQRKC